MFRQLRVSRFHAIHEFRRRLTNDVSFSSLNPWSLRRRTCECLEFENHSNLETIAFKPQISGLGTDSRAASESRSHIASRPRSRHSQHATFPRYHHHSASRTLEFGDSPAFMAASCPASRRHDLDSQQERSANPHHAAGVPHVGVTGLISGRLNRINRIYPV